MTSAKNFTKVLKLFTMCAKFQVNKSSLSEKSNVGNSLHSPLFERLRGKNTLVEIGLNYIVHIMERIRNNILGGKRIFASKK